MTELKISTDPRYIEKLCDGVASYFGNPPRLLNPKGRAAERLAAAGLKDNGYRLARLFAILEWCQQDDYWNWVTSVAALGKALLEPKDFANSMESKFDAWQNANPPRCAHFVRLDGKEGPCFLCARDPECKQCLNGKVMETVPGVGSMIFMCNCVAKKLGKPLVAEQIEAVVKKNSQ
jgi:hypothetical protein